MTLQEAIQEIQKRHFAFQLPIQMIEFEDGSGFKFNYRLNGESKPRFILFKDYKATHIKTPFGKSRLIGKIIEKFK